MSGDTRTASAISSKRSPAKDCRAVNRRTGRGSPETIGCDIGGTSIQVGRLRGGRASSLRQIATPGSREELLESLAREVCDIRDGTSRTRAQIAAVGVAFCGLLDRRRRSILHSTHLDFLDGCRMVDRLERRLQLPVVLDADTNAGAVAEATLGAGRRSRRMLYLSLGTGVGAALTVDATPVRASFHTIGQVAQLPLVDPLRGSQEPQSAESLLSAQSILRRAKRLGLNVRTTEELYHAARSRRKSSRAVWRQVGELTGQLLRLLTVLWSPEVVVVGGGVALAGEFVLPAAKRYLSRTLAIQPPELLQAEKARGAGAIGAAILARQGIG